MHEGQAEGRGRREAFLAALQEGRSVTGAALAAGVNRTLLYKWRNDMPDFAAAWDEAAQTSADLIEDEALRRAIHGVQRPVFWRGEQIGVVTTYSDRLLALLLQRRRPAPPVARARAKDHAAESDLAERLAAARQRVARFREEEEAEARPAQAASAAAASDRISSAAPLAAPAHSEVPATMPAAPPPDDEDSAPVAPKRLPPRRADTPEAFHGPPLSQMTRVAHLSSAQLLEALTRRPPDPGLATFGPPWGR